MPHIGAVEGRSPRANAANATVQPVNGQQRGTPGTAGSPPPASILPGGGAASVVGRHTRQVQAHHVQMRRTPPLPRWQHRQTSRRRGKGAFTMSAQARNKIDLITQVANIAR